MKANYPYIQDIYIYCTINRQFLQVENGELLSNMRNFSGYQINRIKSGLCRSMLTHFSRRRRQQWKRQPRHFLLNKNGLYRTVCKDQIKTKSRFYKKKALQTTYLRHLQGIDWCRWPDLNSFMPFSSFLAMWLKQRRIAVCIKLTKALFALC